MKIRFIIEIIGKPVSIVNETLKKIVSSVNERYKVTHSEFSKPSKIEGSELMSAFSEFEFVVKSFEELMSAILDYGPTVVEIVEPSQITFKGGDLQNGLADLLSKIHAMSQAIQQLQLSNIPIKKSNTTKK